MLNSKIMSSRAMNFIPKSWLRTREQLDAVLKKLKEGRRKNKIKIEDFDFYKT